jgi:uncharacterized Zn-finger protein
MEGIIPLVCEICTKSFTHHRSLFIHRRIHTGEKPFSCVVCQKNFSTESALSDHARTHTGIKRYKCDICENAYAGRSGLFQHKKMHSGEKPYSCDICNKSYSHSSLLSRHIKTPAHLKRQESVEAPYGMIMTPEDIECEIKVEEGVLDHISKEQVSGDLNGDYKCEEKKRRRMTMIVLWDLEI